MTTTTDTREAARARLLEHLTRHSGNCPDCTGTGFLRDNFREQITCRCARSRKTVFTLTRYQSRARATSIVDFLVIRDNRPVSISREILQVLPEDAAKATAGRFSIPPGNEYTGLVLTKDRPEDIVNRLSMILFGRYCLDIETL